MSASELLSLIAASASAVAGVAAAVAAFRSAKSAEESRRLAEGAELRAQLREISAVASAARAEHHRVESLVARLKGAYGSNAVATGGFGGSRHKLAESQAEQRLVEAKELLKVSEPFQDGPSALTHSTAEDADRVLHVQRLALTKLQAIASQLATELNAVEGQQSQFMQAALAQGHEK